MKYETGTSVTEEHVVDYGVVSCGDPHAFRGLASDAPQLYSCAPRFCCTLGLHTRGYLHDEPVTGWLT
jgi:hypothetical protein